MFDRESVREKTLASRLRELSVREQQQTGKPHSNNMTSTVMASPTKQSVANAAVHLGIDSKEELVVKIDE